MQPPRYSLTSTLALFAVLALGACTEDPVPPPMIQTLYVTPLAITLLEGESVTINANAPTEAGHIQFRLLSGPGDITPVGRYTAPGAIATDSVRAVVEVRPANTSYSIEQVAITVIADSTRRVCFTRDVKPMLLSNCALAGCHDPASRQRGYDFTQDLMVVRATTPGEPEMSLLYLMITHRDGHERMPPPPRARLADEQIALLGRWITEGSRITTCLAEGEDCGDEAVRYSTTIRTIMLANCTSCHDGPGGSAGIDLTTHAGVRGVAFGGELLGSITHAPGYAPMPSATSRLDSCDIVRIRSWIDAGAPDN